MFHPQRLPQRASRVLLMMVLILTIVQVALLQSQPAVAESNLETTEGREEDTREQQFYTDYADFMKKLPTLSVALKKTATIECKLDRKLRAMAYDLTWIKLNRSTESSEQNDNQPLISLNNKVISPNKRYKVMKQSQTWWQLKIDDIKEEDGEAIYLCRAHPKASNPRNSPVATYGFMGGARLQVLIPPRMIDEEKSPSLVTANEYEPASLRCKVYSLNVSSLSWLREDGKPIGGRSSVERTRGVSPTNRHLEIWFDSSELMFDPFSREHSGVYLCVATNGVGPGISQRMELLAVKCRQWEAKGAPDESCSLPRGSGESEVTNAGEEEEATTISRSSANNQQAADQSAGQAPSSKRRVGWKTNGAAHNYRRRPSAAHKRPPAATTNVLNEAGDGRTRDRSSLAFASSSSSGDESSFIGTVLVRTLGLLLLPLLLTMLYQR